MKVYISKIENTERIFFIFYIVYMVAFILNQTFFWKYFPEKMDRYVLLICVLFLVWNEVLIGRVTNFKSLIGLAICLVMFAITYFTNGNAVAGMIVFIYCGRNISFEKIAKITIYVTGFMLIIIMTSAWLGIIDNYMEYSGNRVRQYIGFRYSLFAPALLYNITLLYVYIKQEKIRWKNILCLLLLNTWFYYLTRSRLSFWLAILALLISIFYKYKYVSFYKRRFIYLCMVFSYLICGSVFFMLTITFTWNIDWMRGLNDFFGNRLYLGQYSLLKYGISVYGEQISWVGNGLNVYGEKTNGSYLWVDCLYIQILQRYGVLFLLLFLFIMTITMWNCYKEKKYLLLTILSLIAVHCMIDDLQLYLHYNTFWFSIGAILLNNLNRKDRNNQIA